MLEEVPCLEILSTPTRLCDEVLSTRRSVSRNSQDPIKNRYGSGRVYKITLLDRDSAGEGHEFRDAESMASCVLRELTNTLSSRVHQI